MSKPDPLRGAYCPLIVPFSGGKIDFDTYGKLIERQIAEGTHGLLVNATSASVSFAPTSMLDRRFPPPWPVEEQFRLFCRARSRRASARVTNKPPLFNDCLMTLFVWNRTSNK